MIQKASDKGSGIPQPVTRLHHIRAKEQIFYDGMPISPGIGYGRPCFSRDSTISDKTIHTDDPQKDNNRLLNAFSDLSSQLGELAEQAEESFDQNTAQLFHAHQMIIDCVELQQDIINVHTNNLLCAEEAIEQCFNDYYEYFRKLGDAYLAAQCDDFTELKNLLLNLVSHSETHLYCREYEGCQIGECALKNDHLYVMKEFGANIAIRIRENTKGVITEKCGKDSHAAMIARSLNIPVVSKIKDIENIISCDDDVLINGHTGQIVINPNDKTLSDAFEQHDTSKKHFFQFEPVTALKVLADIDRYSDVQQAIDAGAEGIGLYRTEFEILNKNRYLSEREQFNCYKNVTRQMVGKPVYIRLFDLGGDKSASWLDIKDDENPAIDNRGAHFLLSRPEVVKDQARAIAKVSLRSPIHVIYPMITATSQYLQLKELFLDAITDIKNTNIKHGVMFEVPSACTQAEELFKVIDFGRIGSNDLIHYLFDYDRTDDDINFEKLADDPALWKIIANLSEIAKYFNKPLEMCGRMTSEAKYIPRLIKHGITTISTRPEYIGQVRRAVTD